MTPNARRIVLLAAPHLLVLSVLLLTTHAVYLEMSLHRDVGFGQVEAAWSAHNYAAILTDGFYLQSLYLTLGISAIIVVLSILISYPAAYALTRLPPRVASWTLAAIVSSSFLAGAVKLLGLVILFGIEGPVNRVLRATGLAAEGFRLIGTLPGVMIGYAYLSIAFSLLMLHTTLRTIPVRLEEAAEVHGASAWRAFLRVTWPLSLPGVINTALIQFNLLMGAYAVAAVLGGGRILTFPVLIQRTLVQFNDYGMGAALSVLLLVLVVVVNIVADKFGRPKHGMAASQ
ncbi:ABC transporter permease [Steroidobacter sp.]|uniref:ABC transporter permease n=1 Tax=Steroidobacter sp. TaxID=1978227 RepID=UPI001A569AE8|nr:ABC transporter permease [Steroidobacter sp.]MBL8265235.1 ABC transporter permease [Steroidobacter sp.]